MQGGLKHVPTVAELVAQGLAEVVERNKKGEASAYRVKPDGYAAIYSAMKYNAMLLSADESARREYESAAIRKAKGVA